MTISEFSLANRCLRRFFHEEGYVEAPTQSCLSILAACEDPETISQFVFDGRNYPLPQTGQMKLEEFLLSPTIHHDKIFCQTTSYRNEPFPILGRHDKIFPMFEFESLGTYDDLVKLLNDLLLFLEFPKASVITYIDACSMYDVKTIDYETEKKLCEDLGPCVMLTRFPRDSHPFWNMNHQDETFNKIDLLLYGMETFGTAERSCDVEGMRDQFHTISDGKYAKLLYSKFGEERVLKELESYFSLSMQPRFGGGIGMTRLTRAMRLNGNF